MMNETCKTEKKPKTFKERLRSASFWATTTALIIGGALGYMYYHYEGCTSGSCGISSSPVLSTLFGAAMGYFIVNRPCRSC